MKQHRCLCPCSTLVSVFGRGNSLKATTYQPSTAFFPMAVGCWLRGCLRGSTTPASCRIFMRRLWVARKIRKMALEGPSHSLTPLLKVRTFFCILVLCLTVPTIFLAGSTFMDHRLPQSQLSPPFDGGPIGWLGKPVGGLERFEPQGKWEATS